MTVATVVLVIVNQPIKRDGCQQINNKPRLQVVFGYSFGVTFFYLGRRTNVSGAEVEEDVEKKDEVYQGCQYDECLGSVVFAVIEDDWRCLGESSVKRYLYWVVENGCRWMRDALHTLLIYIMLR